MTRLPALQLAIFRRLGADRRAATIVEFGLILPVMALLLMGAFDVGHTLYMTTTMQGAVQ
ncbi:MAG: hypothetical protein JWN69_1218, partial [Alphaproteobacteria bacterium]|nr:hypothetical protein [Alphaproteobacteria bacterium]